MSLWHKEQQSEHAMKKKYVTLCKESAGNAMDEMDEVVAVILEVVEDLEITNRE